MSLVIKDEETRIEKGVASYNSYHTSLKHELGCGGVIATESHAPTIERPTQRQIRKCADLIKPSRLCTSRPLTGADAVLPMRTGGLVRDNCWG